MAACLIAHSGLSLVVTAQSPAPAPSSTPDAFAKGGWHLELLGQAQTEAWNYNESHEALYGLSTGFTYGLRDGLTFVGATPMFYVAQRTTNATMVGLTGGLRQRIARRGRASCFVELEVGVSDAEIIVPPRGTRFNYIFQPGAGVTLALGARGHLVAGVRWFHLSNASLAGPNRNPDIEALGLHGGILLPFDP